MPLRLKRFLTKGFVMVFPVLALGVLAYELYNLIRSRESCSWPVADGVITHSSVTRTSGEFNATVSYTYSVRGIKYTGSRLSLWDYESNDPADAESIVKRYPEDARVRVYYCPEHTEMSVLEPGVKGTTWIIVGGSIVAIFISCRMVVVVNRPFPLMDTTEPSTGGNVASPRASA